MSIYYRLANEWRRIRDVVSPGGEPEPRGEGSLPVGEANYPVPPGAVWVSTTGSNSNSGTQVSPYRTIKHAANVCPSGGTIVVKAGTYHEGAVYDPAIGGSSLGNGIVFANHNITVQNAPGEEVWLDGSEVVTGWAPAGTGRWSVPFVTRRDRSQTHTRGRDEGDWPGGEGFTHPSAPYAIWSEMVFLDGVQLEQVGSLGDVGPGKFFVEGSLLGGTSADKNLFTSTAYIIGDNPAGREVRISTLSRAIHVNKTGIALRGFGIRRYNAALVEWGTVYYNGHDNTADCLWENIVVEDIAQLGAHNFGNRGIIRYCTIRRCGNAGLSPNSDDMVIEHNFFHQNNYSRYNYGPSAGAIKFHIGHRLRLAHNRFEETYGHAFWADVSVHDAVIYNNDFINNHGHGVGWEISATCYIVNNLFVDQAINATLRSPHQSWPIWVSGSTDANIWSNTFVNSETHIRFGRDGRDPFNPDNNYGRDPRMPDSFFEEIMTWSGKGHTVFNNIVYKSPGLNSIQACFYSTSVQVPTEYFELDTGGNLFNRLTSSTPSRFANGARDIDGVTTVVTWFNPANNDHLGGPSWSSIVGETNNGSVLVTGRDAMSAAGEVYTVNPAEAAAVGTHPMPERVAQRVGLPVGFTHLGAWR